MEAPSAKRLKSETLAEPAPPVPVAPLDPRAPLPDPGSLALMPVVRGPVQVPRSLALVPVVREAVQVPDEVPVQNVDTRADGTVSCFGHYQHIANMLNHEDIQRYRNPKFTPQALTLMRPGKPLRRATRIGRKLGLC